MAPSTFYISQGATAPAITATLVDQYGTVANLTGASVKFVMTNAFYGNAVNAAATIVNATAGQVSYSWGTSDTSNPGLYGCQWQVVYSGGAQETYPQGYYNQVSVSPALTSGFPEILQPSSIFNTIWNGTSNPTSVQGNNGDFWYNSTTGFFFGPKAAGVWPAGSALTSTATPLNQFAAPVGNLSMAGFDITNLPAVTNSTGTLNINSAGTMLVPNGTDTLATLALAQTLTNKTLVSPVVTGTPAIPGLPDYHNVVTAYGADPTGVADSTAAIQSAINAVQVLGGGVVYFPAGLYKVTPVSSTSAALVLNDGATTGYQNIRLVGASEGVTLKRSAAGPIITMSGVTSDTTGVTHCRYCSLEDITLNGNNLTGTLIQAYYADDLFFSNAHFTSSNDVLFDCAEFWDSRFINCLWDSSGSLTANTTAPMLWLRNSAASSGFGYSSGTTNNIYLWGCRWEQYKTGAVRIERGPGINIGQPYSLYFSSSKFETAVLNGGNTFFCDVTARDIHVHEAHTYVGGFYSSYATAQDVYSFAPQFGSLKNILIFNSVAAACVANGVTVGAPLANSTVTLRNVRGSYTGGATPTGAHLNFGTLTGTVEFADCLSDNGTNYSNSIPSTVREGIITSTTTYMIKQDGTIDWGAGTGAIDASLTRAGAGLLYAGANMEVSGYFQADGLAKINAGSTTAASAPVLTPAFVSGTAAQLSDTTRDYMVYLDVTTAGTATTIAIGPTSTPANTLVASASMVVGSLYSFRLPAGWFVKWTGTLTAFAQKAIGC